MAEKKSPDISKDAEKTKKNPKVKDPKVSIQEPDDGVSDVEMELATEPEAHLEFKKTHEDAPKIGEEAAP